MGVPEIRVEELKRRLDAGENLFLLDVRDESEFEISNIGGQLIPLNDGGWQAEGPSAVPHKEGEAPPLAFDALALVG